MSAQTPFSLKSSSPEKLDPRESIATWQISIEEVENAIDSYRVLYGFSEPSVGDRLATPEFRLKLLRCTKVAIEEIASSLKTQKLPYHSLEMRLRLESCLYQTIDTLLKEDY
ncbi:MAG: hypothetical protein SW833_06485 [Cyanobacteriota bacterium]|nr:hypothetical protein [Cyanobacteriota bacterium]